MYSTGYTLILLTVIGYFALSEYLWDTVIIYHLQVCHQLSGTIKVALPDMPASLYAHIGHALSVVK